MSVYEKTLARKRLLLAAKNKEYLFRCNSGQAYGGKLLGVKNGIMRLLGGAIIKLLPPGTPDYCGFKPVVITQEMVGKKVAVFLVEEHKATKYDKMRENQIKAKRIIVDAGGIHRTVDYLGEVDEVKGYNLNTEKKAIK